ncbi:DUF397 domain-containing protein [Streptomyces sp. VRA16 Mangrove soil]|uniref:DUF397 domain-containing protein n=1 Tax=Streptomyces sp. VRA16 Mangrove soil TaxID=2817434 RepID=UPI001A9DC44E|nr:DUF397 domain-containing protein [Streptomyces sp. VRA16 Mangrove soil]MBO1337423.1 DUF397 domain-containing protein [Streptomyces sp. VRA16 Mangrove soil]
MGTKAWTWRKSSYSGSSGGECLEVAETPTAHIAIRDSKDPGRGYLRVGPVAFTLFVEAARGRS